MRGSVETKAADTHLSLAKVCCGSVLNCSRENTHKSLAFVGQTQHRRFGLADLRGCPGSATMPTVEHRSAVIRLSSVTELGVASDLAPCQDKVGLTVGTQGQRSFGRRSAKKTPSEPDRLPLSGESFSKNPTWRHASRLPTRYIAP